MHLLYELSGRANALCADKQLWRAGSEGGAVRAALYSKMQNVLVQNPMQRLQRLRRLPQLIACGSSNSAIELTLPEHEKYSQYVAWVDVSKRQL